MVRATYWATKLLPYARCRRSAKCPGPILLVTSRPLSRRRLLPGPLLAIRILCAVLRILPAVGLVRPRPSLVVVTAASCFGPAANPAGVTTSREVSGTGAPPKSKFVWQDRLRAWTDRKFRRLPPIPTAGFLQHARAPQTRLGVSRASVGGHTCPSTTTASKIKLVRLVMKNEAKFIEYRG